MAASTLYLGFSVGKLFFIFAPIFITVLYRSVLYLNFYRPNLKEWSLALGFFIGFVMTLLIFFGSSLLPTNVAAYFLGSILGTCLGIEAASIRPPRLVTGYANRP